MFSLCPHLVGGQVSPASTGGGGVRSVQLAGGGVRSVQPAGGVRSVQPVGGGQVSPAGGGVSPAGGGVGRGQVSPASRGVRSVQPVGGGQVSPASGGWGQVSPAGGGGVGQSAEGGGQHLAPSCGRYASCVHAGGLSCLFRYKSTKLLKQCKIHQSDESSLWDSSKFLDVFPPLKILFHSRFS